jgi:predicted molibdopterin-dependent oxidoreductase YjgC
MVRKVIDSPGEARCDWRIVSDIANRMGAPGFDFNGPDEIMEEIRSVTPIYGGISYNRIEEEGLQWPCRDDSDPGAKFLHEKSFPLPEGKGRLFPLVYRASVELPDKEYPMLLTTDRSLYHYHTSTMTRRVAGLEELLGEELLLISDEDATEMGISSGDMLTVQSRRGKVKVKAEVTHICPKGVASLTFHFHETPTNELTICAVDPVAKIPETKVCAVKVERVGG